MSRIEGIGAQGANGHGRTAPRIIRASIGALAALAASGAEVPAAERKGPPGTGGIMIPYLGGEQAVRGEFAEIKRRGTAEAYALFIERHPDHPLAQEARRLQDAAARKAAKRGQSR